MENKRIDLLTDIVKLLKKYSPEVFYDLANFLKDEKLTYTLEELLIKISEEGKKHKIVSSKKREKPLLKIREQLISLKESDKEKSEILLSFYDKIYSQGANLKLKDIKNFALDSGLDLSNTKLRDDAISKLLLHFIRLPLNELTIFLSQFKFHSFDSNRSLESWSNIILKKRK